MPTIVDEYISEENTLGGGGGGPGGDKLTILQTKKNLTANYSIDPLYNAASVGPVTTDLGVTVTVPLGSTYVTLPGTGGGGGGGAGVFPGVAAQNAILYDPNATPTANLVFNDWATVLTYISAGTWTASNPLLVFIAAGEHNIDITSTPYVTFRGIGEAGSTRITGGIYGGIGFAGIASLFYSTIANIVISNFVGTASNFLLLQACTILGGTAAAGTVLVAVNCSFNGADMSSVASMATYTCLINGGIFPELAQHFNAIINNEVFGFTLQFKGGKFYKCTILGTATFLATYDADFYGCIISYSSSVAFPTLNSGEQYNIINCTLDRPQTSIIKGIDVDFSSANVFLFNSPGFRLIQLNYLPADFSGGATGIQYTRQCSGDTIYHTFFFDYTVLPPGVSTLNVNIFYLGANGRILSYRVTNPAVFSGGSVSAATVDGGIYGVPNAIVNAQDIFTAPGVEDYIYGKNLDDSGTAITFTITITGDTFENLTSGQMGIQILEKVGFQS